MVRKEIISLHIGQCGLQIGINIWELFLIEHNINIEGELNSSSSDMDNNNTFFQETLKERYTPRSLLIDSESSVIDDIKTGVFRTLFNPRHMICGVDDGASNFARGSFCIGNKYLVRALNQIRALVENCEILQAFILTHSFTGGTGSGLTSVLLHALYVDYPKIFKLQIPILPGSNLSTSLVDPYNATLHLHSSLDSSDVALLIENQSLYNMCKKLLLIYSPFYTHINRIVAILLSSITCSMRFNGPFKSELVDIGTNLIPYPRIHFPVIAHAPIFHESRQSHHIKDLNKLMNEVFSKENLTVNCNLYQGRYMSVLLNARGDIPLLDVSQTVYNMKMNNLIKFVEWSPKGFKMIFSSNIPVMVPESCMGITNNSLTMMCNNTSIKNVWTELGRKFDLLFIRRAYLHWYIDEGMEETEFMESRLDLAMLWEDYEEISMTSEDIEKEITSASRLRSRYSSLNSVPSSNYDT